MNLSEIGKPQGANKRVKRRGCGRGSGHGRTSCRGNKGQLSRSGRGTYIGYEGGQMPLMRRLPKRGFHNFSREEYQVINVYQLNEFKDKDSVDILALFNKGLITRKNRLLKILGEGELKKAVTIKANKFSKSAIKKIQEAGGKVEYV